jgi:hypothetical protein
VPGCRRYSQPTRMRRLSTPTVIPSL